MKGGLKKAIPTCHNSVRPVAFMFFTKLYNPPHEKILFDYCHGVPVGHTGTG